MRLQFGIVASSKSAEVSLVPFSLMRIWLIAGTSVSKCKNANIIIYTSFIYIYYIYYRLTVYLTRENMDSNIPSPNEWFAMRAAAAPDNAGAEAI